MEHPASDEADAKKKSLIASEQQRPDVALARENFFAEQLVLIDAIWSKAEHVVHTIGVRDIDGAEASVAIALSKVTAEDSGVCFEVCICALQFKQGHSMAWIIVCLIRMSIYRHFVERLSKKHNKWLTLE